MNITFGYSDNGKMMFMMKMADLFHLKKKNEKLINMKKGNINKLRAEIDEINTQGQRILKELEIFIKRNRSKAVVAFAQF